MIGLVYRTVKESFSRMGMMEEGNERRKNVYALYLYHKLYLVSYGIVSWYPIIAPPLL